MDIMVLLASAIRLTTPLLFAALGGLYSEKSGIVNIALEGIMIFGALTSAVVSQQIESRLAIDTSVWWIPWIGVAAAILVGAFIALIHAVASIKYRADQVISGTAINLLAIGVPSVVLQIIYNNTNDSLPIKNRIQSLGPEGMNFSILTYLAFLLVPLTAYLIFKTRFGLRLRSVGENPEAAASVGVNVIKIRYVAVIISGVLASLAGVYLSIGNLNAFTRNLSAGQGFIALAALIFGRWNPWGALGSSFLFGLFGALAIQLGGQEDFLPPAIVQMLPFILTILVLAGFMGRSNAPKSVGKPYP